MRQHLADDLDAQNSAFKTIYLEKAKDKLSENKLTEMLDNLDVNDRHYNRKYADMSNRLDDLYDKIDDIEQSIDNIDITF